jgi:MFS family permease
MSESCPCDTSHSAWVSDEVVLCAVSDERQVVIAAQRQRRGISRVSCPAGSVRHAFGMRTIAVAVLLGLVAFPVVLVFGPTYFPWTLLVLAVLGGVGGLMVRPGNRHDLRALAVTALMSGVVVLAFALTSQMALQLASLTSDPRLVVPFLVWVGSLLVAILVGAVAGVMLRARWGVASGVIRGLLAALAVAVLGIILAFVLAPPEVAAAANCSGPSCARSRCAFTAERTRFFALERVTELDATHVTCTYTAWGGLYIGRVDVSVPAGGSTWTDGDWPLMLRGGSPQFIERRSSCRVVLVIEGSTGSRRVQLRDRLNTANQ